ncbi:MULTISPECIES: alpha/beta hydrolase [unclassified Burkholderia]|uniref:alpha/beta hydrolase n=1 Tax=unclassified Burkholderia TaxID=2613784 RepID=UPI00075AAF1B|nr:MULTISPECIES: alpha/beta fold hydrolase [unclassified Burkholderia]KVL16751.1 lysophospholipase [Burkholderia sp. MSMB1826]KWE61391.1 lysophospholipase [Burkholderia sp. MSMB2157WGS]
MSRTYADQPVWRAMQAFLPPDFQWAADRHPDEQWWRWRGHRLHLDTYRNPRAQVKAILFHGVGTNGRQMSMIVGEQLARRGYETIAVDMPEYGMTEVARGALVRYDDWVRAGSDLIDAERAKDDRPIVLYGLSAGGMLTYHVAALNGKVDGIVGMTFLDQRLQQVRDETARNLFMSRVGGPMTHFAAKTPLRAMRIPMSLASKMHALVNRDDALKVWMSDRTSAGNAMTMAFLDSYMSYRPVVEPEDFSVCPILLTQPAADRWTPLHLSEPFLARVRHVPVKVEMLENAGHYPLEQPGLSQMVEAIDAFYRDVTTRHAGPGALA